jgi:hypothetical protein
VVAQDYCGTKQLVAYVVARANSNPSNDQLRGFLASKVPGYAFLPTFSSLINCL